jgi:hypothetical protein
MHKLLVAMIAIGASTAAIADWVKIAITDKSTIYADPSTIRKVGTTAKMWYTFDYKASQQLTMKGKDVHYLSTIGEDEFDCKGLRKRRLLLTGYSKNMGGGDIVATDSTQSQWAAVLSGTAAENMWKLACGKR